MLIIPGAAGRDTCDRPAKISRRELLRVGGSSILGLSLADILGLQRAVADTASTAPNRLVRPFVRIMTCPRPY